VYVGLDGFQLFNDCLTIVKKKDPSMLFLEILEGRSLQRKWHQDPALEV
jgi:hypothetical protein